MSIEELRGIKFCFNHSATEKAMDDILFDKYESEQRNMQLPKRDRILGGYICQECNSVWSGIPLPFTYCNGKWMCPDCFQKYQKE